MVGGWGAAAMWVSMVVMVSALFTKSDAVAMAAGAVFILAAVLAAVGHVAGEI